MNVSIDISMYPLHENFEEPIKSFIKTLRKSPFHTEENGLSTQIFGDYSNLMAFINENMYESLINQKNCVFVLKIVSNVKSLHEPNY